MSNCHLSDYLKTIIEPQELKKKFKARRWRHIFWKMPIQKEIHPSRIYSVVTIQMSNVNNNIKKTVYLISTVFFDWNKYYHNV